MPKTYFAYNPFTAELIGSTCFKRVYESALLNLRYSDSGVFNIYATNIDIYNYSFKDLYPQMTSKNLRCKIRTVNDTSYIKVDNYVNGRYTSGLYLTKRDPYDRKEVDTL